MRPPICAVCGKRFDPNEGKLLSFQLTQKDQEWQKHANETTGFVGHPPWLEWFCPEHVKFFEELQTLTLAEAMKRYRTENRS